MSSNIFDKPILLKKNEVELLKFLRANTKFK